MELTSGQPWDVVWEPLDLYGKVYTPNLVQPFSFRSGGVCLDCGSRHVSGLTIMMRSGVDLFAPETTHYDRAAVFTIMACASWHTYVLPTDYPEELRLWLFSDIRNHGDVTLSKNDVGDNLSDRWSRFLSDAETYPAAAAALHEAAATDLEWAFDWPLTNVRMYIPGPVADSILPGYRLWEPTPEDMETTGTIERS